MTTSLIDADSLLVIDIGSISTRAMLFDVVDGRYRFLAQGAGPTTAAAPFHSVSEGVRMAIDQLHGITGRILIGPDEQLITPSSSDGSGIDIFAAMFSAGPPLKIVVVGLLESVSVESARRLAMTTYGRVEHVVSLNDGCKPEERMDAILRLRPDLIIIAGGTEGGASQSVLNVLEAVGLACYLLPKHHRPEVLYVGNQSLRDEVQARIGELTKLYFAPNVRPALEVERLDAARSRMNRVYGRILSRKLSGVQELDAWTRGAGVLPTSAAFGRVIQFLSGAHKASKGVLGIEVEASAITLAAAFDGRLYQGVYPQPDLESDVSSPVDPASLDEIRRWLTVDFAEDQIREYLLHKSLYPASQPAVPEEFALEQALLRQSMCSAVKAMIGDLLPEVGAPGNDLLPGVEPIIASGALLIQLPTLAHSVLTLLDGLQPTGVTTLILDQHHIASALGAAAGTNPLLMVQILDSNAFLHVGTVIAPVGKARPGTPILRLKVTYESGNTSELEIKQGELEALPLPLGQAARLQLQPLHRFDIGMGAPGRGGSLRVSGGALGVIIDARGRPLALPGDFPRRAERYQKWLWALGGQ
jgi:hypothetical protein